MNLKTQLIGLLLAAPVIAFLGWYGFATVAALTGATTRPMSAEEFQALDAQGQIAHIRETATENPAQVNVDRLFAWIEENPRDEALPDAYQLLGDLRMRQIFSTEPAEFKQAHLVKPGDSLRALSIELGSTPGAIMRANNLLDDTLHPGQRIQIPLLETNAVVHLEDRQLVLYLGGQYLQSYPIEEVRIPEEDLAKLPLVVEVEDKPSLYGGQTVRYGEPAYLKSSRRITLEDTPIILYSHASTGKNEGPAPTGAAVALSGAAAAAEAGALDPAGAQSGSSTQTDSRYTGPGIQLSRAHMEDVFLLLTGQSRVKITR